MAARNSFFFLQIAVVLSLLVTVTLASHSGNLKAKVTTGPECETVYGTKTGDTCFSVTKAFNLPETLFSGINPNLDCDKLFVGQWLCVAGTPN